MKFVSKSGNLCITLKPGIPANPLAGTPNDPGIHIRFDNGMVTVNDEELVRKMKSHAGFNIDFFEINEEEKDPYGNLRRDKEPGHQLTKMEFGHPAETFGSKKKINLTPEMIAYLNESAKAMAQEIVKEVAPAMALELVKKMSTPVKEETVSKQDSKPTDSKTVEQKEDELEDESEGESEGDAVDVLLDLEAKENAGDKQEELKGGNKNAKVDTKNNK